MFNRIVSLIGKDANALLVVGGTLSGVFLTGGYYFSMKERYERQVEALHLQLNHEKNVRELHDEYMQQKMNHERDQQALAILHLRRDNEMAIKAAQLEIQRLLFDVAFHGDYEKFRDDMDISVASAVDAEDRLTHDKPAKNAQLPRLFSRVQDEVAQPARGSSGGAMPSVVRGGSVHSITITLKDPLGAKLTELRVPNDISVGDLKYQIEDRLFIHPTKQRLFFKGVHLQDGPALDDYEVSEGSTIHLRTSIVAVERPRESETSRKDKLPDKLKNFMIEYPAKLQDLFDIIDRNHDQVVSYEEVKAALYETIPGLVPEDMAQVFHVMDNTGTGFVNRREWMELFALSKSPRKSSTDFVSQIERASLR